MIGASWRQRWQYLTPFLALPADLRRVVLACSQGSR
jgi:hypothetical protein